MPSVPFPVTSYSLEDVQRQVNELFRSIYEDRVGGLYIGDVFTDSGGVLTISLGSTNPSLEKNSSSELDVKIQSAGGLQATSTGIAAKLKSSGGLAVDANGLYSENPVTEQDHITDASTANAVTDPATATGCTTLRDDLVTNTIPSMETRLNEQGTKINAILKALEDANILKTS
jgi:hypothetical protein